MASLRSLGRTELSITSIGLGCWQFSGGQGLAGGYWDTVPQESADAIVRAALAGGINWFDTAELYGFGRSERALAQALLAAGKKNGEVIVATKWWPAFRTAANIPRSINDRIAALSPFGIDLYQIHQAFALATVKAQMEAMADLCRDGLIRTVGVSNFSARRMREAHAHLQRRGLPLASNQVRYSLLDRRIERNGVLAAARELGVTIIAYSPLAQGILTGKFHDDPLLIRQRSGPRRFLAAFRRRGMERTRPLIAALRAIAQAHGATAAQVALAWVLQAQGDTVVAIPGASKESQVADLVAAMDLRLQDREINRIEELSRPFL